MLSFSFADAQTKDDLLRPFFGFYDSQSLTNSVGRATVASGYLIPGKTSNPANLSLNRFYNLSSCFINGEFESEDSNISNLSIGGFYAILPYKVFQGSMVFGLGIQRDINFSNASLDTLFDGSAISEIFDVSEKGGLYSTQAGIAVEFVENLFIGAEISYLSGEAEASKLGIIKSSNLKSDYHGFEASIGFVQRVSPHFRMGASIQLPSYIWVDDTATNWPTGSTEKAEKETREYTLKRPLVFHAGFAVLYEYVNLFYEWEWTDWRNLEFSSDQYFAGDVIDINTEIQDDMKTTSTQHLGMAVHPPWIPLHLYTGYQYMPTQYSGSYNSDRRQSLSFGMSYVLNQQMSVHSSYTRYFWQFDGEDESFIQYVFGFSLHY